jgi:anaphase-promoting complex subunit 10
MPTSTRRQAQYHMPPPPAEFSDSDQDVDEEGMEPEGEMGEEMVAMDGDEDLEEEDGLGKSFLAARPGFVLCHVT